MDEASHDSPDKQPEKQQRDFTISVRLRPDMREKLRFVADAVGVSPATMAGVAIGHYISQQITALTTNQAIAQEFVKAITPGVLDLFKQQIEAADQVDPTQHAELLKQALEAQHKG